MSFTASIPASRISVSNMRFDASSQERRFKGDGSAQASSAKQTVNISQDTLLRLAKQKLSRAVGKKLTYNSDGYFAETRPVGAFLSTSA